MSVVHFDAGIASSESQIAAGLKTSPLRKNASTITPGSLILI